MAQLSMRGSLSFSETADIIKTGVVNSAVSAELVDVINRTSADGDTLIKMMAFEKYYWRSSNRASLTVLISGRDGDVYVDAIGAGGGQGIVFKLSWGAEEDFVGTVRRILEARGFVIEERE